MASTVTFPFWISFLPLPLTMATLACSFACCCLAGGGGGQSPAAALGYSGEWAALHGSLLNVDTLGSDGDVWEAPSLRIVGLVLLSLSLGFGVGDMGIADASLDGDTPGVVCLEGPADAGGDWNGVAALIAPQSPLSKANLPKTPPSCFHSVDSEVRRERPVKVLSSEMTVR